MFIPLFIPFFYKMTKPNHSNPFPVKLGNDLKPFLQQEAVTADKSLHFWIKKILNDYKEGREKLTLHQVS